MLHIRMFLFVVSLLVVSAAHAQSVQGYVIGGAGGWVHDTGGSGALFSAAGGGEWLMTSHLGLGGEGGILADRSGGIAATLGADLRLHFRGLTPADGWAPYAFAGYSPLRFFGQSDQGLHYGTGLDYRLSPRRALRFEVRDILRDSGSVRSHYWTARVGLTFR